MGLIAVRSRTMSWTRRVGARVAYMTLLLGVMLPSALRAQSMPDHLDDHKETKLAPVSTGAGAFERDGDYAGLLAMGYLLALPAAAMTGGVGVFLPVGMHHHSGNSPGGQRAVLGILGGIGLGGLAGGLIVPPKGDFHLTRSMIVGALSGFFLWGAIDVAFFSSRGDGEDDDFALTVDLDPRGQAGLRVFGHM